MLLITYLRVLFCVDWVLQHHFHETVRGAISSFPPPGINPTPTTQTYIALCGARQHLSAWRVISTTAKGRSTRGYQLGWRNNEVASRYPSAIFYGHIQLSYSCSAAIKKSFQMLAPDREISFLVLPPSHQIFLRPTDGFIETSQYIASQCCSFCFGTQRWGCFARSSTTHHPLNSL